MGYLPRTSFDWDRPTGPQTAREKLSHEEAQQYVLLASYSTRTGNDEFGIFIYLRVQLAFSCSPILACRYAPQSGSTKLSQHSLEYTMQLGNGVNEVYKPPVGTPVVVK
jgi:hypothetical protein